MLRLLRRTTSENCIKSAQQNGALVSSLFPEDVRDALLEEQEIPKSPVKNRGSDAWKAEMHPETSERSGENKAAIANLYENSTIMFAGKFIF